MSDGLSLWQVKWLDRLMTSWQAWVVATSASHAEQVLRAQTPPGIRIRETSQVAASDVVFLPSWATPARPLALWKGRIWYKNPWPEIDPREEISAVFRVLAPDMAEALRLATAEYPDATITELRAAHVATALIQEVEK